VKASVKPLVSSVDRYDLPFDETTGDVVCLRDQGSGRLHFNITRTRVHHSPTGWEWGYEGSGPADFALNIVDAFVDSRYLTGKDIADADDLDGKKGIELWDGTRVPRIVWRTYQLVKRQFLAKLPYEGGTIPGETLRDFLVECGVPKEAIR
jgi:hypothetical protein